eukprot:TRINITY_DN5789_c1_g2_i1.p1 TRINITY_DN5789_c1_g2~~TRINITY_DN5789_c1_g2_i1.p1  ORF type:complete len:452 (+),score=84.67 TRINITY_DN5789_c1_g2_i1:38-1393(+)
MDDIFEKLLSTGGGIFVDSSRKLRDTKAGSSTDRKKASLGKPIENVPDSFEDYDYEEMQRKCFMRSGDEKEDDVELDDMIWFVSSEAPTSPPQSPLSPSSPTNSIESTFIRRRTNPESFPVPRSIEVDWRATIFLNLITQWEYILTVAVCRSHAEGRKDLVALKWSTRRVYAQPSNNNNCTQKKKKHAFQNTWPHIFFSVDDFQEAFGDIRMGEGYCWCVELVAVSKKSDRIPVFRGVVPYDKMVRGFAATSSANKKNASFLSRKEDKTQIISMRGPEGRGNAKAEVSKIEPNNTLRCCLVQVSAFWGDIVYCLEYPVRSNWLTIPTEEELKQELILNEELETARKNAERLNKLAESDLKEEKGFGLMKVFSGLRESIQKKLDGEMKISLPAIGSTVEVIDLKQGDWKAFNGKQGTVKDYHSTINDALIVSIDGTSVTIKVQNTRVISEKS